MVIKVINQYRGAFDGNELVNSHPPTESRTSKPETSSESSDRPRSPRTFSHNTAQCRSHTKSSPRSWRARNILANDPNLYPLDLSWQKSYGSKYVKMLHLAKMRCRAMLTQQNQ